MDHIAHTVEYGGAVLTSAQVFFRCSAQSRVDLAVEVGGHEPLGDATGIRIVGTVGEAGEAVDRVEPAESERGRGPATRREVNDPPTGAFVLAPGRDSGADDVGVERTGEAAVASHEQQADREREEAEELRAARDLTAWVEYGRTKLVVTLMKLRATDRFRPGSVGRRV